MKKNIKLTEAELKNMISEAIKSCLTEGHTNQEICNTFFDLAEAMGFENFILSVYNWFSADEIEDFIRTYSD